MFDDKEIEPEEDAYRRRFKPYDSQKVTNFSELRQKPEYFDGLLNQMNNALPHEGDAEEIIRSNEKEFVEGASASTEGPFKYMSRAAIELVHEEVDDRMQEL